MKSTMLPVKCSLCFVVSPLVPSGLRHGVLRTSDTTLHSSSFLPSEKRSRSSHSTPHLPALRRRTTISAADKSQPESPVPTPDERPQPTRVSDQTFFGLRLKTNGDVLKFGFVAIAVPFAIKALIQTAGVPDLQAGQITTAFVSVFALVAWVSTYVFRVGTKNMTYAQQLRDYEDAVIQKRYEELSSEELNELADELNEER